MSEKKLTKVEKREQKLLKLKLKQEKNLVGPSTPSKKNIGDLTEINFTKTTPGDKKLLNLDVKTYDVKYTQHAWVSYYKKNKLYKYEQCKEKEIFTIPLPPPNITGKLHLGHTMMLSIQDSIVRYHRMCGKNTGFIPGLDHAGIATQTVVEKTLSRINNERKFDLSENFEKLVFEICESEKIFEAQNISLIKSTEKNIIKFDKTIEFNRQTLLKLAHSWSAVYSNFINTQMDILNCSFDSDRRLFTMDPYMQKLVEEAFCSLYDKKLIFRKKRIVNWCSVLNTTLSDLEVDNLTVESMKMNKIKQVLYDKNTEKYIKRDVKNVQGCIYQIKYPLIKKGEIFDQEMLCIKETPLVQVETSGENIIKDYFSLFNAETPEININNNNKQYDYVIISTTRPETIFGDTALCYNPTDSRYKILEQYNALNPLTLQQIPIITDTAALKEFGTGILKITPCHDPIDFEIGQRNKLESLEIFDEKNLLSLSFQPKKTDTGEIFDLFYKNTDKTNRFEARHTTIKFLHSINLLESIKSHQQTIPICSRSGDIVEPVLKDQWWCSTDKMCSDVLDRFSKNEFEVQPKEGIKNFKNWMNNPRDWCLSRQLWWGHRIPAYKLFLRTETEKKFLKFLVATENKLDEKISEFCKENELKRENLIVEQDEDVLDTWFSSGLWAIATSPGFYDSYKNMGTECIDFNRFNIPHDILETGSDILFFWVCRMLMLTTTLCDIVPFKTVLLHGIVRDSIGRKMSKSLGNVVDPLHLVYGCSIEQLNNSLSLTLSEKERNLAIKNQKKEFKDGIKQIGSDALRFGLCNLYSNMRDINLSMDKLYGYRRYCNKIWNACNLLVLIYKNNKYGDVNNDVISVENNLNELKLTQINIVDYINMNLNNCIEEFHGHMDSFNLNNATNSIYELSYLFFDNYLELLKSYTEVRVNKTLILSSVCTFVEILKVLSVFMPYVTEELFQRLLSTLDTVDLKLLESIQGYKTDYRSISLNKFPEQKLFDKTNAEKVEKLIEIAKNLRAKKIDKEKSIRICLKEELKTDDMSGEEILKSLCRRDIGVVYELGEGYEELMEDVFYLVV